MTPADELHDACDRLGVPVDWLQYLTISRRPDGAISVMRGPYIYGRIALDDRQLLSTARRIILADRLGGHPVRPREGDPPRSPPKRIRLPECATELYSA